METRPGVEQILVELDGSHIRTGKKVILAGVELTPKRQLPKYQRQIDWREVRVGLARSIREREQRTYVAQMSKYPEVVGYLVRAAVVQGMSTRTQVYAVADGGNGLREALSQQVPKLTFILDRPDLKHHLYRTHLGSIVRITWITTELKQYN